MLNLSFHRCKEIAGLGYTLVTVDDQDEFWMAQAIAEARRAAEIGEVPVGAAVVSESGVLLASACNETIRRSDPTAHAEILALRAAGTEIANYRLSGTTVYATVEPCAMCAGALVNARVARLVFGTRDERFGAVETLFNICDHPSLNHRLQITSGVLADECRALMQAFFKARR